MVSSDPFWGLLEGLLAKRPGVIGLQLSKLAKDPNSRILRTQIRHSPKIYLALSRFRTQLASSGGAFTTHFRENEVQR